MIQKVTIQNFQSHKYTVLDFCNGMNVIIGATDSGKTSILRALNWVMTNKPSGDSFRSSWGGDTIVEIVLHTGETITRKRGNTVNSYQLDEIEFTAFGQDVPEEIKNVLNISDINSQQQMDAPFLLSETSGTIASYFNKVAKLDMIDIMSQNVQKEIKTITSGIGYAKETIAQKEEQIAQFTDVDTFEEELLLLEQQEQTLIDQQIDLENLKYIITTTETYQQKIQKQSQIIPCEKLTEQLLTLYENVKENKEDYETLKKLSLQIYYTQQGILKKQKTLENEEEVNTLHKNLILHTKSNESRVILQKLIQNTTNVIEARIQAENKLKRKEDEFHENFPDICPLCGRKKLII